MSVAQLKRLGWLMFAALLISINVHTAQAQLTTQSQDLNSGSSIVDSAQVLYSVSFPELKQQFAQVDAHFPSQGDEVAVRLPTWVPGSYLQQPFDANVQFQSVRNAAGDDLLWRKTEKDTWLIGAAGEAFVIRYRVRADERSASTSWVGDDYILLNGASVFLYTDSTRQLLQVLQLDVPPGMGEPATSLDPVDGSNRTLVAGSYDSLLDQPVLISTAAPVLFSVARQDHYLVNAGDARLWDELQAVKDLERISAASLGFWNQNPLSKPYWFLNVVNENRGGLEHDHSTVMQSSRWQMTQRREYIQWLSLASHEYFHVWNGRRLKPQALADIDYRNEQYTDSLWITEGLTSYYDDLLLSRAKVITAVEYLNQLAANIHRLELTPGRQHISIAQASRDSWTRHYQPSTNSLNQNVSYYIKGAIVGFVLDTQIRKSSRNRDSLDDVMQHFWATWNDQPFPERAFLQSVEAVAGEQIMQWVEPLIFSTAEADVDEAMEWYGLRIERNASLPQGSDGHPGLGINWMPESEVLRIGSVIDGGAASRAGLLAADELIAINDIRVEKHSLEQLLRTYEVGQSVSLLVARQGRMLERDARLTQARVVAYAIAAQDGFGGRQLRRLTSWLGQSPAPQ